MSYVDDNLGKNEKVLLKARVSWGIFLPAIISFAIVVIYRLLMAKMVGSPQENPIGNALIILIFLFLLLWVFAAAIKALIFLLTSEFAVTNRRLIAKYGFIRRHTVEMLLLKVESVSVQQSIYGRIFNFGTLIITGTGGTRERFFAISKPLETRKKVNEILEWHMRAYSDYQARKAVEQKL